jgi:predicted amidohydrolase
MDRNYTIGLVQMESTAGNTQRNLEKIMDFAENAAGLGVDILCFPEMALHGYSAMDAKKLPNL